MKDFSHTAGICNLPLRLHILTRTTFFCCSSSPSWILFLFTHCAASVHCTSKLIILQLKWLHLVLWNIWNDDKVKGSAVSFSAYLPHESILMKWGEVPKGEKMSISRVDLVNKSLHSRRHTQLQEMNKWLLRKVWPPSFSAFCVPSDLFADWKCEPNYLTKACEPIFLTI